MRQPRTADFGLIFEEITARNYQFATFGALWDNVRHRLQTNFRQTGTLWCMTRQILAYFLHSRNTMLQIRLRMYANNPLNVCDAENASVFSRAMRGQGEVDGVRRRPRRLNQCVCDAAVC